MVSTLVGGRNTEYALHFLSDLKSRLSNRVQLTSDGHRPYLQAVDTVFGDDVDYAMLVKIYGSDPAGAKRYSPAKCLGARKSPVIGEPDKKHISMSFAERQNLTMRMHMRRFTRLTNAFSKKLENHGYNVALYSMFYNFVRIHQTLKVSPAMAAGVTDKLWEIGDIITMVEAWEAKYVTAGITYRVGENEIGGGYFVRVIPRYELLPDPVYGFKTREEAEFWIKQDRTSHKPGRRRKLAAI